MLNHPLRSSRKSSRSILLVSLLGSLLACDDVSRAPTGSAGNGCGEPASSGAGGSGSASGQAGAAQGGQAVGGKGGVAQGGSGNAAGTNDMGAGEGGVAQGGQGGAAQAGTAGSGQGSTPPKMGTAIETHTEEPGGAMFFDFVYASPEAFSWEFWFSVRQPVTSEANVDIPKSIMSWGDEAGCEDIRIGFGQIGAPDRSLSFSVDAPGECGARDATPLNYYPPGGFVTDEWHHVVGTHSYQTGVTALYVDGEKVGSKLGTKMPIARPMILSLGRFDDGSPTDPNFDGRIDEVRVYSRVLSEDEILLHALDPKPGSSAEQGLVAGWHLDEGSGMMLKDYSGHSNDGLLVGGAMFVPGHLSTP